MQTRSMKNESDGTEQSLGLDKPGAFEGQGELKKDVQSGSSRVEPLKAVSIPRLELAAATLAVRVADLIRSSTDRDNGFALYTVYFYFTKAFDRVDHALLLLKLSSFGIGGKLLNFISSYLDNRTQRVKISDTISNPTRVRSGVIQGSVLGPLLFCLFVNDVPDLFQNEKLPQILGAESTDRLYRSDGVCGL
ncbi:Tudor domain containing 12 [Sparganum proliferum]